VVAMNDHDNTYNYPEIVKYQIRDAQQKDYLQAVDFINFSDADVCILQHEYGIFGGENGIYLLPLIRRLVKPLIAILHTVLKNPSYNEKAIIQEIGKRAAKLVVMSNRAVDFLTDSYGIDPEKIAIIEHGVPVFNFTDRASFKKKLNLTGKKSLFTFGLLSKDKGIETVINALPEIVNRHPEILYIVLGKTHPEVIKTSGEQYRNYLRSLVEKNNLGNHVRFFNRFATNKELFSYLAAADIYIIPNLNKVQITSGTLAYAIGAGSAVVSTAFWHARELLAEGRGRLFNFGDSNDLATILDELLSNQSLLDEIRVKAYQYGRMMSWPEIGRQYLELISEAHAQWTEPPPVVEQIINPLSLPDFDMSHVKKLTDTTGILQHAKYTVPDFHEGYCLDDNARALLLCVMAYRQKGLEQSLEQMSGYLAFVDYMQNENGTFRNFLSFSRDFLDEMGSEDCFGRTIWALGYLIRFAPNDAYFKLSKEIFLKAYPHFKDMKGPHGIAYTILGISHYLHHASTDADMIRTLDNLTDKLMRMYESAKDADWFWFDSKVTYANGILPLALLQSYEISENKKVLKTAGETMDFLERITFKRGFFMPVGSDSWYAKGGEPSRFAQQPIDAMAMVLMYYQAFFITRNTKYARLMSSSFMWFLGENELGMPLYDFETHGCCDGIESSGANNNQGAESTLAYHIAHLTVLLAHE
jgi:glycosyltransferase involved in cell wall biosynthesis